MKPDGDDKTASPNGPAVPGDAADGRDLQSLIIDALPEDSALAPLKGFKMDISANRGFRKAFFSAKCKCGTAALLSAEVAQDKTAEEIDAALPSLVERLETQAKTFRGMSCDVHKRMQLGPQAKL